MDVEKNMIEKYMHVQINCSRNKGHYQSKCMIQTVIEVLN